MVPIDLETGALAARGRRRPDRDPGFLLRHPDTGVEFASVRVPHWEAVLQLVKAGARALHPLGSLGWDVAVTPEGPVAIEANAYWAPESFQFSRGLRPTPLGRLVTGVTGTAPARAVAAQP
jgi:hypothetical protein